MADRVVFVDHGETVGEHHMSDLPRAARRTWRIRALDRDALVAALAGAGRLHGTPGPSWVDVELE